MDPLWLAIWLILGITLGHLYDLWASRDATHKSDNVAGLGQTHTTSANPQLQYLFAALGRIAKAGGRVRTAHVTYATSLMQQMGMDKNARTLAQGWFNAGKSNGYSFQKLARACLRWDESTSQSRLTILRCMCHMAVIEVSNEAIACLKQLGGYLGFSPAHVAREFGDVHNTSAPPQAQPESVAERKLKAAFERLGVAPDAPFTAVKHAYRQKVSRHHPDKLPVDASEGARRYAQQQMIELRDALELIQSQQN